jgi:hypothetical protein
MLKYAKIGKSNWKKRMGKRWEKDGKIGERL